MEKPAPTQQNTGIIRFEESLGYFISPTESKNAVVGFNNIDVNNLPPGFQVGDMVEFRIDPESQTNASTWTHIK